MSPRRHLTAVVAAVGGAYGNIGPGIGFVAKFYKLFYMIESRLLKFKIFVSNTKFSLRLLVRFV